MHRNRIVLLVLLALFVMPLAACGSTQAEAASAVEDYINALVAKDDAGLSALSCADWEANALLELDSFQAVAVRLEDLACQETGIDDSLTLVACQGKIIATYDNEDQELDLSARTYEVVEQGGEYLICGYR